MSTSRFLFALAAKPDRLYTVGELLDLARQYRFDGSLTIHFRGGIAQHFDGGRPVLGKLRPAVEGVTTKPLDTVSPSAASSSTRSDGLSP